MSFFNKTRERILIMITIYDNDIYTGNDLT